LFAFMAMFVDGGVGAPKTNGPAGSADASTAASVAEQAFGAVGNLSAFRGDVSAAGNLADQGFGAVGKTAGAFGGGAASSVIKYGFQRLTRDPDDDDTTHEKTFAEIAAPEAVKAGGNAAIGYGTQAAITIGTNAAIRSGDVMVATGTKVISAGAGTSVAVAAGPAGLASAVGGVVGEVAAQQVARKAGGSEQVQYAASVAGGFGGAAGAGAGAGAIAAGPPGAVVGAVVGVAGQAVAKSLDVFAHLTKDERYDFGQWSRSFGALCFCKECGCKIHNRGCQDCGAQLCLLCFKSHKCM